MDSVYLVRTYFVHNDASTGYRGLDRGDPWFPYFKEHEAIDPRLINRDKGSDENGGFANFDDAVAFKNVAQEIGIACEVIYIHQIEKKKSDDVSGYQLLGYDVCQNGGGFNSAIVNLLLTKPDEQEQSAPTDELNTIHEVALYFMSLLNDNLLFRNQFDAESFLRAYNELDEKYWNSSEKQLYMTIFAIYVAN